MSDEFCSQANQDCKAPAGYGNAFGAYACVPGRDPVAKTRCFRCGFAVCSNSKCSRLVKYLGKRHRLCASCIAEEDGSP